MRISIPAAVRTIIGVAPGALPSGGRSEPSRLVNANSPFRASLKGSVGLIDSDETAAWAEMFPVDMVTLLFFSGLVRVKCPKDYISTGESGTLRPGLTE